MLNLLFTKTKIMDQKTTGIVTYLTLIGWIVALVTQKEKTEYTSFHIRQMLGIMLTMVAVAVVGSIIGAIIGNFLGMRFIFNLLNLFPVVLWIIGLVGAFNGEMKLVPVLGEKYQEWFKSM